MDDNKEPIQIDSSSSSMISSNELRSLNWKGSIPIVLSLAPTSLSSPTMPPPIHILLSRHTFLHVGLKEAVIRLYRYAPPTFSFRSQRKQVQEPEPGLYDNDSATKEQTNKDGDDTDKPLEESSNKGNDDNNNNTSFQDQSVYPTCWFEDEHSQVPLRWHLFVGVLYDSLNQNNNNNNTTTTTTTTTLPWNIRLHFTSYPSSQLLELNSSSSSSSGVLSTVERTFRNSFKQALFLQYGNSKVAMNMTKQSHQRLWDSIVHSNYSLYQQINQDVQVVNNNNNNSTSNTTLQLVPIRLLLDSKPPIQKRVSLVQTEPIAATSTTDDQNKDVPRESTNSTVAAALTLGQLFRDWIPNCFQAVLTSKETEESGSTTSTTNTTTTVTPESVLKPNVQWRIAGIVPPLSTPILYLWRDLCHPDHFLYIVVTTTQTVEAVAAASSSSTTTTMP